MRAARLNAQQLRLRAPGDLAGGVLLGAVRIPTQTLPKGTVLDVVTGSAVIDAANADAIDPVRIAWPEEGEIHEDDAAHRLAHAATGPGIRFGTPRQSRIDLVAAGPGVLYVATGALTRLNALPPLEVFTLFHGQAVDEGQVVGAVKVAPHIVPLEIVERGELLARRDGPIVRVAGYLPLRVGAIVAEDLPRAGIERFTAAARTKVEALGGTLEDVVSAADPDPAQCERRSYKALEAMAGRRDLQLILVGGVSAGDPLSPFYAALNALGGRVLRQGVPAHPGSMLWIGVLHGAWILGLPQCGAFSMATAADLVLPRIFTGEQLSAESLAELGHGGLLVRDMRFRFPSYARELEQPGG
ncbi:MAG: hypothetical protein AB7I33_00335 [Gemmatimonadales bacterium]